MPKDKSMKDSGKRREKIGVLLIIEGFSEDYKFDWAVGFFDHLFPAFPKGFFTGGPKEGKSCYTLIHYANHEEAEICGVKKGTPIDAFGNEYKGTYPVHSLLDHFSQDDSEKEFFAGCYPDLTSAIVLTYGHSTIDPVRSEEIMGPHIDDPDGSGIGIADFIEMFGFKKMENYYHLPNKIIPSTRQYLKWWYGNDIPAYCGHSPSTQGLTNIKDELKSKMPDYDFVFRHGSESHMRNLDPYGNPEKIADSTETAINELIHNEGVDGIVVVTGDPIRSNITCYGPEWYDKNGQGVSAISGKTFKECVEDLSNGLGPATKQDLDEYLATKPWDIHKVSFPEISCMVKEADPKVKLAFTRSLNEFQDYEQSVLDVLKYTVAKYSIPETSSLCVILAGHGIYGGWKGALECDCYSLKTSDLFSRIIAGIKADFSWLGKFDVVCGENEFSEAEHDSVSQDKPFGDVWSVGERIDAGINGQYVNELGAVVDNGTDNFDYIIVIPVFTITEVLDNLVELRETLGNNVFGIVKGQPIYTRAEMDQEGVPHYGAKNFDNEYFTVKVFDATDCPSIPGGMEDVEYKSRNPKIYKGSSTKPTTVIITGSFLSLGNGPARTHLTEAAVQSIIEAVQNPNIGGFCNPSCKE